VKVKEDDVICFDATISRDFENQRENAEFGTLSVSWDL
jgi:hypothetical protein